MEESYLTVGPWGGNGGNNWDDGVFNGVKEIKLFYDDVCAYSIVMVYDMNGRPFKAQKHGGGGGNETAEVFGFSGSWKETRRFKKSHRFLSQIKVQYPNEFLISVSGHYGPPLARLGGDPCFRSLTFQSNRRSFGPYAVKDGTPFTFSLNGRQVLGLKGLSGMYLDAIGFHV